MPDTVHATAYPILSEFFLYATTKSEDVSTVNVKPHAACNTSAEIFVSQPTVIVVRLNVHILP